jgi:hypothetical protein
MFCAGLGELEELEELELDASCCCLVCIYFESPDLLKDVSARA